LYYAATQAEPVNRITRQLRELCATTQVGSPVMRWSVSATVQAIVLLVKM